MPVNVDTDLPAGGVGFVDVYRLVRAEQMEPCPPAIQQKMNLQQPANIMLLGWLCETAEWADQSRPNWFTDKAGDQTIHDIYFLTWPSGEPKAQNTDTGEIAAAFREVGCPLGANPDTYVGQLFYARRQRLGRSKELASINRRLDLAAPDQQERLEKRRDDIEAKQSNWRVVPCKDPAGALQPPEDWQAPTPKRQLGQASTSTTQATPELSDEEALPALAAAFNGKKVTGAYAASLFVKDPALKGTPLAKSKYVNMALLQDKPGNLVEYLVDKGYGTVDEAGVFSAAGTAA